MTSVEGILNQSRQGGTAKMLVLSRRNGESVVIGGGITVTVLRVKGNVVQLGIDAPKEVGIHRSELRNRGRELELSICV
jgi:carbon storage regulator